RTWYTLLTHVVHIAHARGAHGSRTWCTWFTHVVHLIYQKIHLFFHVKRLYDGDNKTKLYGLYYLICIIRIK
ncbi:MAG: hypothetical protein ACTTKN_02805, partial [Phocaeicola sp.]